MPAKKCCKLIQDESLQPSTSTSDHNNIDWNLCALCQKPSSQYPAKSKRTDVGAGYDSLGDHLETFRSLGTQPITVDIAQLDDGVGISQTLANNSAKWHSLCRLKCSTSRLARLQPNPMPPSTSDTRELPYTRRQVASKDLPAGYKCFFVTR